MLKRLKNQSLIIEISGKTRSLAEIFNNSNVQTKLK